MNSDMATHKKITITMHPIDIEELRKVAKENGETFSGMITRLLHYYKEREAFMLFSMKNKEKKP